MVSRSLDSDEVLSLLTLGEAFALFLKKVRIRVN